METYTPEQIRVEIRSLIANLAECAEEEFSDTADFTETLGIDSLVAMEIMIAVDRRFKIEIPEEDFNKAKTVNESVRLVEYWLAAGGNTSATA